MHVRLSWWNELTFAFQQQQKNIRHISFRSSIQTFLFKTDFLEGEIKIYIN